MPLLASFCYQYFLLSPTIGFWFCFCFLIFLSFAFFCFFPIVRANWNWNVFFHFRADFHPCIHDFAFSPYFFLFFAHHVSCFTSFAAQHSFNFTTFVCLQCILPPLEYACCPHDASTVRVVVVDVFSFVIDWLIN